MANEKRLIDVVAFIEDHKKEFEQYMQTWDTAQMSGFASLLIELQTAPTVDAVEVVHGRWLNAPTVAFTEECSACGFCVPWDADGWLHKYNYCPNCGAKMDGDGNGV